MMETIDPPEREHLGTLSHKEEAVLSLLATGSTRTQIARRLALSESTIGHLLTAAKEKLGGRTLPHAVHIYTERIAGRKDGS